MREIKFRAWDGKQMHYNDFMAISLEGERYSYSTEVWWTEYENDSYDSLKNVVLMQFAGLKDVKDKEIYEGDIISIDGGGEPMITNVFFEEGCFCCKMNENTCELKYYIGMSFCETEIIGNIYENPELLPNTAR